MTHVQKFWKARDAVEKFPSIPMKDIEILKNWMMNDSSLPNYATEEQIILFHHSCFYNMEDTKKCIEKFYKLRYKATMFFQDRDVKIPTLRKSLQVLHYGILPERTPEGYKIVFHNLNDTNPENYTYNDGFKLLCMMIDAVYAKEGPQTGLIILFDMRGVKLGHLARLSLNSIRRTMEYLQEAIPVRLQAIHVVNVHSVIDKIMMLVKPFLNKKFLDLLHFYKENDEEVFKAIPKKCMPSNFGGELESIEHYHEKFLEEMNSLRPIFIEEEKLIYNQNSKPNIGKLSFI